MRAPRILFFILLAWMCACSPRAQNWTEKPFDAKKAASILFQHKLITTAQYDSLQYYTAGNISQYKTRFDWTKRSSFLNCLGILKNDIPDSIYRRYREVTDKLPWDQALSDSAVRYMEIKDYGHPMPGIDFYNEYKHAHTDSLENRISRIIDVLVSADLIQRSVWEEMQALQESSYRIFLSNYSFSSLCEELQSIVYRYENFDTLKAEELFKARILVETGAMDETGFERLNDSYITGQLKDNAGLAPFCKHGLILDLADYSDPVGTDLNRIVTHLAGVAGLRAENIKMSEPWWFEGPHPWNPIYMTNEKRAELSMEIEGKTWRQVVRLGDLKSSEELLFGNITYNVQQVLNKALASKNSEYRLHQMAFSSSEVNDDHRRLAFVLLTKPQVDTWKQQIEIEDTTLLGKYQYSLVLSAEIFDPHYSPQGLEDFWQELDSMGLLAHLSPQQKDSSWREVSRNRFQFPDEVLIAIPGLCSDFKYYDVGGEQPIAEQLTKLNSISRGLFTISDARDTYPEGESGKYSVWFSWNGKKQHWRLHTQDYDAVEFWDRMYAFLKKELPGTFLFDLPIIHHLSPFLSDGQIRVIQKRFPGWAYDY